MELYISFFLASVLLAITPGPDNLFVLAQSAAYGARVGVIITLGLCTGLLWHTALVALGVAQLVAQTTWALPLLALFGAIYLSYLAWGSWRADSVRAGAADAADNASELPASLWQYYGRGVLMNITNPKVLLFFLAFLPQFVRGEQAVGQQIAILGGVFIGAALLVFSAVAVASRGVNCLLNRSPAGQQGLNRAVAVVFALLALRLYWMVFSAL